MTKRPSLAASMKAVKDTAPPAVVHLAVSAPPAEPYAEAPAKRPYFAASREGMKRLTFMVPPEEHRRLKRLAVDTDRTIEEMLREALNDYFAKAAE